MMPASASRRISGQLGAGTGGQAVHERLRRHRAGSRNISRGQSRLRGAGQTRRRGLKLQRARLFTGRQQVLYHATPRSRSGSTEAVGTAGRRFARHAVAARRQPGFCAALRASEEVDSSCGSCASCNTRSFVTAPFCTTSTTSALGGDDPRVWSSLRHRHHRACPVDVPSRRCRSARVDPWRSAAEHPLACRLAAEMPRSRVLFFATAPRYRQDMGGAPSPGARSRARARRA
jgi:hypothetical protein